MIVGETHGSGSGNNNWDTSASEGVPPSEALVVDIEGFEGPLDVLLALARTQKLDLAKISVVALVDQYSGSSRVAECAWKSQPTTRDRGVARYLKSAVLPREEKQPGCRNRRGDGTKAIVPAASAATPCATRRRS